MIELLILIVPFLYGAIVGSFLNVCIYRMPIGLSVVSPPSSCPNCKSKIAFYDNVPILSYLILGGKCRVCKTHISARYPMIEALNGALTAALFYKFGISVEFLAYFVFTSSLVVVTFIDLKYQIIPNAISLPGIAVGFGAAYFMPSVGLYSSGIGIIMGGGILLAIALSYLVLTGRNGLGIGDVKLLAMIGAFVGWQGVLVTIFTASFVGALIGVVIIIKYGKSAKFKMPFGPFLAFGALVHIYFGQYLVNWYFSGIMGL